MELSPFTLLNLPLPEQELVTLLVGQGISVQLVHSMDDNDFTGYVRVMDADGEEVASSADAQHNRKYYERPQIFAKMAEEIAAKVLPKA
jgi:hypothetical protein